MLLTQFGTLHTSCYNYCILYIWVIYMYTYISITLHYNITQSLLSKNNNYINDGGPP